jgi:Sec-independent protein translocase protein TatA
LIILQGFFGLGFSEVFVVIVAIILILGPKNIVLLKPLIKRAYRSWLDYKSEVKLAQKQLEEVEASMLEPIKEAKKEAEKEFIEAQRAARAEGKPKQKKKKRGKA